MHSTIDCVALAIRTPVGIVIHTGDFKIDHDSTDGQPFDLHAFGRYGEEGVLALFSDSTNVERPGYTPSERNIRPRIEELTRAATRKVIVSCFASSIPRIQQIVDIAAAAGRKVGFIGWAHGGQRRNCTHGMNCLNNPGRSGGANAGNRVLSTGQNSSFS